jgi:hypothetical protein
MTYRIYFHNSQTGEAVLPENATQQNLQSAHSLFTGLKRADSYIGFETENNIAIQLYRQKDAIWWLEILDTNKPEAIGTHINIPMAERAIALLYSGDTNLEKFKEEYPFLVWREVRLGQSS